MFLRYGLMTDTFVSYHPVLMRQLLYIKEQVSMTGVEPSQKFNFHFGSAVLEVIRAAVACLPTNADNFKVVDKAVALESSQLEWTQFIGRLENFIHKFYPWCQEYDFSTAGVLEITEHCLKKWSVELSRNKPGETNGFCLNLLTSAMSFFATFTRRYSLSGMLTCAE